MGRPTNNPKTERFEVRLAENEAEMLKKLSATLKISKSSVIVKSLFILEKDLDKYVKAP